MAKADGSGPSSAITNPTADTAMTTGEDDADVAHRCCATRTASISDSQRCTPSARNQARHLR